MQQAASPLHCERTKAAADNSACQSRRNEALEIARYAERPVKHWLINVNRKRNY